MCRGCHGSLTGEKLKGRTAAVRGGNGHRDGGRRTVSLGTVVEGSTASEHLEKSVDINHLDSWIAVQEHVLVACSGRRAGRASGCLLSR